MYQYIEIKHALLKKKQYLVNFIERHVISRVIDSSILKLHVLLGHFCNHQYLCV